MAYDDRKTCPGYQGQGCWRKIPTDQDHCANCEADQANAREITQLHTNLTQNLAEALLSTRETLGNLTVLVSDRVFDADLAEGTDGADMRHELEAAARHLRNAIRIDRAHRAGCTPPAEPAVQAEEPTLIDPAEATAGACRHCGRSIHFRATADIWVHDHDKAAWCDERMETTADPEDLPAAV